MYYYNYPCMRPEMPYNMTQYDIAQEQMMYPLEPIGTTLPTGMPVPQSVMPPPSIPTQYQQLEPETLQDPAYIPGFLKRNIGQRVKVEFLIGSTGPLVDRNGTLLGVGANYILMRPDETDDLLMADLYSIKYVTIFK